MSDAAPAEATGTKLFIGNLSWETNDSTLEELFSKYGVVREARVAVDRNNNRSRGFGFVTMEDAAAAEEAVRAISGTNVNGRDIRVEVSTGERKAGGERRGGDRGDRRGGDRFGDRRGGDRGDRRGDDRRGGRDFDRDRRGGGRDHYHDRRDDRDHRRDDRRGGRDFDRRDRSRDRSRDRF